MNTNAPAVATTASRERLPNRRPCTTFAFELNGLHYQATIGFFPDNRPGEIFLNQDHSDSLADVLASDAAIAVSLALQHGCSIKTMKHALKRNSQGEPSSPIGTALDRIES
jgi:hypothetical protein